MPQKLIPHLLNTPPRGWGPQFFLLHIFSKLHTCGHDMLDTSPVLTTGLQQPLLSNSFPIVEFAAPHGKIPLTQGLVFPEHWKKGKFLGHCILHHGDVQVGHRLEFCKALFVVFHVASLTDGKCLGVAGAVLNVFIFPYDRENAYRPFVCVVVDRIDNYVWPFAVECGNGCSIWSGYFFFVLSTSAIYFIQGRKLCVCACWNRMFQQEKGCGRKGMAAWKGRSSRLITTRTKCKNIDEVQYQHRTRQQRYSIVESRICKNIPATSCDESLESLDFLFSICKAGSYLYFVPGGIVISMLPTYAHRFQRASICWRLSWCLRVCQNPFVALCKLSISKIMPCTATKYAIPGCLEFGWFLNGISAPCPRHGPASL